MSTSDLHQQPHLLLKHRFPAQAKELCQTRSLVRTSLIQGGCHSDTVEDIVLAIDEACQNVIRHAYQGETKEEIFLTIERDNDALLISLRDEAQRVSPDCIKSRDLDDIRPGGLGFHFIQQVMDEVSLNCPPEDKGNILRMVKRVK